MLFNLAQKYASVTSAFVNTLLIIHFLDLSSLGQYAFLTASANIFAAISPVGLRSVYLREIVRSRGDDRRQRALIAIMELVPKLTLPILIGIMIVGAPKIGLSQLDAISIAAIGALLASAQLTSQKVRAHGFNTLSQLIVNCRPMIFLLIILATGLLDLTLLTDNFRFLIIASFALPAILAYGFWLVRFRTLIFRMAAPSEISAAWRNLFKELPGLFMLSFGQKALARLDVILVTALLNLEAAGIYRVCTQIVTVANASLFPLSSKHMKRYSRLIGDGQLAEAKQVERQIARSGTILYVLAMVIGLVVIYLGPFLEGVRYRSDFMMGLAILSISGLLRASIPMVENYVVFSRNANKGGIILIGLVAATVMGHAIAINLFGLPGAFFVAVLSVFFWRFVVRRLL